MPSPLHCRSVGGKSVEDAAGAGNEESAEQRGGWGSTRGGWGESLMGSHGKE